MRLAIYEWDAWHRFMLVRVVPEAIRLTAQLEESADAILERLSPSVDALALHLNLTRTSAFSADRADLLSEAAARGIVVLNGAVTDISKRAVQAQCRAYGLATAAASPEGEPTEDLFIKTDLNFGGRGERKLSGARCAGESPAVSDVITHWQGYHVSRREAIPAGWWDDPALVIERFIDNDLDHLYRINFAGDHAVILRLTNPHPIKKIYSSLARLDIYCRVGALADGSVSGVEPPVGAAFARYVEKSGMDFGAIEIIPDNAGNAYIIDVNSTPYGAIMNVRILMYLRRGLMARIAERAAALGRSVSTGYTLPLPTWRMLRQEVRRLVDHVTARYRRDASAHSDTVGGTV